MKRLTYTHWNGQVRTYCIARRRGQYITTTGGKCFTLDPFGGVWSHGDSFTRTGINVGSSLTTSTTEIQNETS